MLREQRLGIAASPLKMSCILSREPDVNDTGHGSLLSLQLLVREEEARLVILSTSRHIL
jgi:hypothetical protein